MSRRADRAFGGRAPSIASGTLNGAGTFHGQQQCSSPAAALLPRRSRAALKARCCRRRCRRSTFRWHAATKGDRPDLSILHRPFVGRMTTPEGGTRCAYLLLIYTAEANRAAARRVDGSEMKALRGLHRGRPEPGLMQAGEALEADHDRRPRSGFRTARPSRRRPVRREKEALGGFYLVDARDLDEAIELAARIPPRSMVRSRFRPIWEQAGDSRAPGSDRCGGYPPDLVPDAQPADSNRGPTNPATRPVPEESGRGRSRRHQSAYSATSTIGRGSRPTRLSSLPSRCGPKRRAAGEYESRCALDTRFYVTHRGRCERNRASTRWTLSRSRRGVDEESFYMREVS